MTMQTTAPLTGFRLAERNWAFTNYVLWAEKGRLELDAPYQRGHVWGVDRQRMLVRSVIEGLPIGAITANDRTTEHWPAAYRGDAPGYAIIDGKQRLTALLAWHSGELSVPASWFRPEDIGAAPLDTGDGPYVTSHMLTARARSRTENVVVLTHEARVPTLAAEEEIFERINFGGVPQGEADATCAGLLST